MAQVLVTLSTMVVSSEYEPEPDVTVHVPAAVASHPYTPLSVVTLSR
jgi:hypothetical protein